MVWSFAPVFVKYLKTILVGHSFCR